MMTHLHFLLAIASLFHRSPRFFTLAGFVGGRRLVCPSRFFTLHPRWWSLSLLRPHLHRPRPFEGAMMRAALHRLRRAAPLRTTPTFATVLALALALAPGTHGMFPHCSSTPRARPKLCLVVFRFAKGRWPLQSSGLLVEPLEVEEKLSARAEDAA